MDRGSLSQEEELSEWLHMWVGLALTSSSSVKLWLSFDLEQGRNPDLPSTQVSFLEPLLTFSCHIFNYLMQVDLEGRFEARYWPGKLPGLRKGSREIPLPQS